MSLYNLIDAKSLGLTGEINNARFLLAISLNCIVNNFIKKPVY